jgi:hypothetical protein
MRSKREKMGNQTNEITLTKIIEDKKKGKITIQRKAAP